MLVLLTMLGAATNKRKLTTVCTPSRGKDGKFIRTEEPTTEESKLEQKAKEIHSKEKEKQTRRDKIKSKLVIEKLKNAREIIRSTKNIVLIKSLDPYFHTLLDDDDDDVDDVDVDDKPTDEELADALENYRNAQAEAKILEAKLCFKKAIMKMFRYQINREAYEARIIKTGKRRSEINTLLNEYDLRGKRLAPPPLKVDSILLQTNCPEWLQLWSPYLPSTLSSSQSTVPLK